ncbi:DNA mismatch repair protein MutS [Prosthecobacter debontii]|uniref:DNA mismatch repair protein MutS n=1 Tax=Prosthecobacter debontii TaxID=48467 RepID=A0A1T4X3Y5_9BACT|nr:DNA mismatch repair protein MutS [Prosthecobacter debontii]SKA84147.1 DNA mismatch repair protein MutS [Prosthecobacter debontii]
MSDASTTPMMKQYLAIRRELPEDVLLFFRLGDFYELFFEDAKVASPLLNVALTKRNGVPMCGVPHHSSQGYIAKLIKAGKRVAIAEQTTDPVPGKIVERAVSQILSAGTINDLNLLESNRANYLAAVFQTGKKLGLAYVDLTTGEFEVAEFKEPAELADELERIQASELLYNEEQQELISALGRPSYALAVEGYLFLQDQADHALTQHFKVKSLDGFGCQGLSAAICAAGAILQYLQFQLRRNVDHIQRLRVAQTSDFVLIDAASQSHLELVNARGGNQHTLLSALDRTCTPMGGRKLRHWVLHPLRDLEQLTQRQDMIGGLMAEPIVLGQIRTLLKEVRDLERTSSRLSQGSGNGRDLLAMATSLEVVPSLKATLETFDTAGFHQVQAHLHDLSALATELQSAIVDEPPMQIKEGGVFRPGYLPELDELRDASSLGRQWIADLQNREIERTGIKSLKIKYNAVFGYFIEVTKANVGAVPADYHRKQTTVNGERYITDELKRMEDKILGAEERSKALEYEEFVSLRNKVLAHLTEIQETASALAVLDALASLAETARLFNYTRPVLNDTRNLFIRDGRHPVLDQNLTSGERFVPNDVTLEPEESRLILITGPNMAGKSTYLRQTALLTLMAQIGSYLPAASAEIGLVDRIFTRIGASDDIARGQSTFMVEMNETALILNNATERSLVILDEIGRGTSTFDGLSIAWSVAEHLHDHVGARTLFATHYHEITALAQSRPAVQNYNVAVKEWNQQIIFLRKILPGCAEKSYGIQVARLAGLPENVIHRAKEVLAQLESGHQPADSVTDIPSATSVPAKARKPRSPSDSEAGQMTLFG